MMKLIYVFLYLTFLSTILQAQAISAGKDSTPIVVINARLIGKDSVIIPFDYSYSVVPDQCTAIIRHGHYDFKKQYFIGRFKDTRAHDSTVVIAEGDYKRGGVKEGVFIINNLEGKPLGRGAYKDGKLEGEWVWYHPNGVLKGKGTFHEDKYVGKWDFYYDNGKPQLSFSAEDKVCKIINAWRGDGVQIVVDGKGYYKTEVAKWEGNLVNGVPDSTWQCTFGGTIIVEHFANNMFMDGTVTAPGSARTYVDASHISLFPGLPRFAVHHGNDLIVLTNCNGDNTPVDYMIFGKRIHPMITVLKGSSYKVY